MMLKYTIPLSLLAVHWFADFVLQTDWQAKNKSSNWNALLRHTVVYSCCFIWLGFAFVGATFITHTITDAITSRINTKLYKANQIHYFFVSIGFDQLIHFVTLSLTLQYLTKYNV